MIFGTSDNKTVLSSIRAYSSQTMIPSIAFAKAIVFGCGFSRNSGPRGL